MYRDGDFRPDTPPPWNARDLAADLDLEIVWLGMAEGDRYLFDIARAATLLGAGGPEAVTYRHDVLADCRAHPAVLRELYELATEAVTAERKIHSFLRQVPSAMLRRSLEALELSLEHLRHLRQIADEHGDRFSSEGLANFFGMVRGELDDAYFAEVATHLQHLRFRDGLWMSARLGAGNRGQTYALRVPGTAHGGWRQRLGLTTPTSHSFEIPPKDEAGHHALSELTGRGINLVANALAQSTDHLSSFFVQLRAETAFYVGCLNLERRMAAGGQPMCVPGTAPARASVWSATGLYDGALALRTGQPVVGNDLRATGRSLLVVTGANSGGKSTFLRSVGLAQLMLRSGSTVFAETYQASVDDTVLTHFARDEDATMERGRFDDELARMSAIVDHLPPHATLLLNETFASTNEWEGSEIGRDVVRTLVESGRRVVFVTHLFDLARRLSVEAHPDTLFLRAERQPDGTRTFKIVPGEPLPTSYGVDLYDRLGGWSRAGART